MGNPRCEFWECVSGFETQETISIGLAGTLMVFWKQTGDRGRRGEWRVNLRTSRRVLFREFLHDDIQVGFGDGVWFYILGE